MSSSTALSKQQIVPQAQHPTKELEDALERFQATLSLERRREFGDIVIRDDFGQIDAVMRFTAKVERTRARKKSTRLVSGIHNFLTSVQQFSSIVDSFAPIHPIAALTWTSIKAFVSIAYRFASFFDDLSVCLNSVQRLCPRFVQYAALFRRCEGLKPVLCTYYAKVFDLCTSAIRALESTGVFRTMKVLMKDFFRKEFLEHASTLEEAGTQVAEWIKFAKRSTVVQQGNDTNKQLSRLGRYTKELVKISTSGSADQRQAAAEQEREHLLSKLSSYDPSIKWASLRNKSIGVAAHNLAAYCYMGEWEQKSTAVLDDVQSNLLPDKVALVFLFCDSTVTSDCLIRSLTKQLMTQINPREGTGQRLRNLFSLGGTPATDSVRTLFIDAAKQQEKLSLLFDGLGELQDHDRTFVLRLVKDLLRPDPTSSLSLMVFLTCREGTQVGEIRGMLDCTSISMHCEESSDQTKMIVESLLEEMQENVNQRIDDEDLLRDVQQNLQAHSGNMLLWVYLMIQEIYAKESVEQIRKAIQPSHLPSTLEEVFDLALTRILKSGSDALKRAKRLFAWTAFAKQPMTAQEICEAVLIEPGQQHAPSVDAQFRRPDQLTSWTAHLLAIDLNGDIVEFAHHSVRTYLLQTSSTGAVHQKFQLIERDDELLMGQMCVTYLHFQELRGILTAQDKDKQKITKSLEAIPEQVVKSVLAEAVKPSIAASISRRLPNRSWSTTVKGDNTTSGLRRTYSGPAEASFAKSLRTIPTRNFFLLEYVTEFWYYHTRYFHLLSRDDECYVKWKGMLMTPSNVLAIATGLQYKWFGITKLSLGHTFDLRHYAAVDLLYDVEGLAPIQPAFLELIVLHAQEPQRSLQWALGPSDWDRLLFAHSGASCVSQLQICAGSAPGALYSRSVTAKLVAYFLNAAAYELGGEPVYVQESPLISSCMELLRRFPTARNPPLSPWGTVSNVFRGGCAPFLSKKYNNLYIPVENIGILAGLFGDLNTIKLIVERTRQPGNLECLAEFALCLLGSVLTEQQACSMYIANYLNVFLDSLRVQNNFRYENRDSWEWRILRDTLICISVVACARGQVNILRSVLSTNIAVQPDEAAYMQLPNLKGGITPMIAAVLGGRVDARNIYGASELV